MKLQSVSLFALPIFLSLVTSPAFAGGKAEKSCAERRLTFSADFFQPMPGAGAAFVWGGNATGGELFIAPPYAQNFLSHVQIAKDRNLETFAYLEGPCGNTDGHDDGEIARCARIHRAFNDKFAPGTPDTAAARWKPFTMKQLQESGRLGVDYCEIDNLENNVSIPLNPFLLQIKSLYDKGAIHCRLVLKNISVTGLKSIKENVAPTLAAANFIAPFHIFEDDDTSKKASLDAAMKQLKGSGAVTIISTDTNNYGSAFTPDRFETCN